MPLYDSLGENAVEYILNHSESAIVFVSVDKLPTLLKALPAVHKELKTLVYWGTCGIVHEGAQQVELLNPCFTHYSALSVSLRHQGHTLQLGFEIAPLLMHSACHFTDKLTILRRQRQRRG